MARQHGLERGSLPLLRLTMHESPQHFAEACTRCQLHHQETADVRSLSAPAHRVQMVLVCGLNWEFPTIGGPNMDPKIVGLYKDYQKGAPSFWTHPTRNEAAEACHAARIM